MANPDRRTTIHGDQIEDGTIEPSEFNVVNSPSEGDALIYDLVTGTFKWEARNQGQNVDGGFSNSVYLTAQSIDGGNA